MTLRFSDDEEFDLEGPPRITRRRDGLYVVGMNQLIPVDSKQEAFEVYEAMKTEYNMAVDEELNAILKQIGINY